ncbi:MAG: PTS lactose/cellobiose transporter subunit IIA [Spirochaetaceae bacterium]|jgi:PTS system cellobiose-specific IIA component|nr:PTS lactose/cellobiose transporter subunit IIA [Spirochaetaceae bacterium]
MENENMVTSDSMNSTAMEIIMLAGDARLCVSKCFKNLLEGDFDEIDKNLEEAKKKLAQAHGLQTEIVQSEGEGKKHEHTLLFIHAQDTLMTVFSEMNMLRQLKPVLRRYEDRIAALERRITND